MRTLFSALAIASFLVAAAPAHAQSSGGPRNTLTANPLGLAIGAFNLEYERASSDTLSWYIGPSYFGLSATGGSLGDWSIDSYGLSGGLRFFFSGRAPEGFFLSPGVSVGILTLDSGSSSATATSWSIGGMLGYTWIFGDVFDLSIGLGVAHQTAELVNEGDNYGSSGMVPQLRFSIGPAF